ncbi:MAG: polyprenyl synthetase family protein [Armatimonadota bacterium]
MPVVPSNQLSIKQVPPDAALRDLIRRRAGELATSALATSTHAHRLEDQGQAILTDLQLPTEYLGFAMVAAHNAAWRQAFAAVPYARRLLLLPHCMRDQSVCAGLYDSAGLHCRRCGACNLDAIQTAAEALGYHTIIAEGTSAVLMDVLEGGADAVLGVACLDSLEKSYSRIADLDIPFVAVPLLRDGCVDTETDLDELHALLSLQSNDAPQATGGFISLLREAVALFHHDTLLATLPPELAERLGKSIEDDPLTATEAIALEILGSGGKRFRPFLTLAAYAAAREMAAGASFPPVILRLAIAIEAMHKASLVHDDIEDADEFRYGKPTVMRRYGLSTAVNVGDYLIGLGYRLIAGEVETLGAAGVANLLASFSTAHLTLCRGQGADICWQESREAPALRDILLMYARKTAPSFEAALRAGLDAAAFSYDRDRLSRFCQYLGQGYQVSNDLDDWQLDHANKVVRGQDILAGRPTVLRAFLQDAGGGAALNALIGPEAQESPELLGEIRQLFLSHQVFAKGEQLVGKLRDRAQALAAEMETPRLRALAEFLVRIVLPSR